jgi:hypothetical protein
MASLGSLLPRQSSEIRRLCFCLEAIARSLWSRTGASPPLSQWDKVRRVIRESSSRATEWRRRSTIRFVSDAEALEARNVSGFRRCARVFGVLALAGAAVSLIANALTIRERAIHTGEADAAPAIATVSWIGALVCAIVLFGVIVRLSSTPRRPSLRVLWISGACGVVFTYFIYMATAALWV